jgi:non-homologous end joining protein Ku
MKTLISLGVILAVLSIYFIVNVEKSIFLKGNEVVPLGTDIPKIIFDNAKKIIADKNATSTLETATTSGIESLQELITNKLPEQTENIKNDIIDLASNASQKIEDLLKQSIENKISEIICPQK